MALTAEVLGMLAFTLAAFWGIATWALVRTMRQESRKVALLEQQDRIDTYSPKALAQLREWVEANPEDPLAEEARERYNECLDALEETDSQFYDWSEEDIQSLERL
ncbi:hypothetical protein [Halobiforma nitratireducens]|uniref:Uncharacterized protein n=1 Tax=Halobiforma nitratireducens JCM 10879 TaxID=1227454 RepID=M0L4U4_9EURY|nr:hypothetical protein [Halobiforma nitratireducens]EMA27459.1 hypothetical protein C446_17771 [Halobiforma nitratireducens JCM 10879]